MSEAKHYFRWHGSTAKNTGEEITQSYIFSDEDQQKIYDNSNTGCCNNY